MPTSLMSIFYRMCLTRAPGAVLFIRFLVGGVALFDGLHELLFSVDIGAKSLMQIVLSWPDALALLAAGLEMVGGLLILLGFFTRFAVMPLLVITLLDLLVNKLPVLWTLGFWKMLHDSRTDYCMVLGLFFLLLVGAGTTSMDAWLTGKQDRRVLKMAQSRR